MAEWLVALTRVAKTHGCDANTRSIIRRMFLQMTAYLCDNTNFYCGDHCPACVMLQPARECEYRVAGDDTWFDSWRLVRISRLWREFANKRVRVT